MKTGHVLGQIRRRHRAIEFRAFLTALDVQVPADLDVHVIMDNYGTHKTALIRRWFARHPRFHPHFTPTYASWLNLVERWFAALETKQLRRGVHDSVRSLESAIREFIDASTRWASHTCGRKPPTTFWLASPASPYARSRSTTASRLCREPLVRDTRLERARLLPGALSQPCRIWPRTGPAETGSGLLSERGYGLRA